MWTNNIEATHKVQEIQRLVRQQCSGVIKSRIHVEYEKNQIAFEFCLNDEKCIGYTVTAELLCYTAANYIANQVLKVIPAKYFVKPGSVNDVPFELGSKEHTDYITDQMQSMTINEIVALYHNLILTKEQAHVVKKKMLELIYNKQMSPWQAMLKTEVQGQFPETNSYAEYAHKYTEVPLYPGHVPKNQPKSVPQTMQELVPALNQIVKMPCECDTYNKSGKATVQDTIIHLNDAHHPKKISRKSADDPWSRERIADWLESLDVDLEIKTPEEVTT